MGRSKPNSPQSIVNPKDKKIEKWLNAPLKVYERAKVKELFNCLKKEMFLK